MTGQTKVLDQGPFLHGTKAVLRIGDELQINYLSNYQEKARIIFISPQHLKLQSGEPSLPKVTNGTDLSRRTAWTV